MSELVANEDRIITIEPQGGWTPGTPNYTEIKSDKNILSGKKALIDKISWTITGCTFGSNVHLGGSGQMQSTAQKSKMESKFLMREKDEGMCNGQFQPPGTPPPPPISCSCKYKISNAGQTKVKSN